MQQPRRELATDLISSDVSASPPNKSSVGLKLPSSLHTASSASLPEKTVALNAPVEISQKAAP